ncbi:hypothetical protein J5N97_000015 [Dioscorea zingiberensis]|uniref:Non-structural maintenance of chromosome element 4 C-terminal domain-containing protein n=1 Tax=Dioscorea zingiberensis TaxID=325984 RepID=A0A9D5H3D8_9LILI|nr:hypothetical protein J5N97_000015 [Dioscorea zingiberensis]
MARALKRERGSREAEAEATEGEERESPHGAMERRALRSRYLAVKNLISDERDGISNEDSDKFRTIITEVESLHQFVQKPREQVADAEALLDIANTLVTSVKSQINDGLTPSNFVTALLRNYGQQVRNASLGNAQNTISWADVGLSVSNVLRLAPGCCTMIGPMDTEMKQRKVAVHKKKTKPTESTCPEELDASEMEEKTDTDKNMSTMFNILRKKKIVRLENLVLNRSSFAQTVENLFALSFLVKDGRARISTNDQRHHLVSPKNAPAASAVASGDVSYHHFVFRFDFKDWQVMKSNVAEGEELMPHRTNPGMAMPSQTEEPLDGESQSAAPTTPIRKLTRNRGLVIQEQSVVDDTPDKGNMAASELKEINLVVKEEDTINVSDEGRKLISPITEDGSMDRKGNPAIKKKTGGWKYAILLLVNYGLSTLAFFGVGVNLVLFLTRVMQQENAEAANGVSKWTGTVYILSLFGAFLSDSYWGRYFTCAIFQFIFVMGLTLLSLSSWFLLVMPSGCGDSVKHCNPPSSAGTILFYLSTYMIAFGNGGYQPSIATFGSDQFDEMDPHESRSKVAFFSYFYLALNAGSLFSNTVLVYYEDSGKWVMGFWVSTVAAALALLLFLIGTPGYRYFKPSGNPLTRIAQVFVAAFRKFNAKVPSDHTLLFEVQGKESAIAGSRKILHSNDFRFLDKAATMTREEEMDHEHHQSWRLCTVTQVEEVKCVLKMLPIWLCTIIYSVVFTQMASLFVEQGAAMNAEINGFHIPAASMSVFDILSVLTFITIYRHVLVPLTGKFSKNPEGLTELQRMGVGLVIGMLAMVAAGTVELERLKRVESPHEPSSLSIMWQIPQYALIGASEVFMYVGQLEFFNGQAPDGVKSFGSSLCMASISLGNYVSIMLVTIVMSVTKDGDRPGWIPGNLNSGHLDRFFFLLGGLTLLDFLFYLVCAKWYKCIKLEGSSEAEQQEKVVNKV